MKALYRLLFWLLLIPAFGVEWLSLEGQSASFWLETESGGFSLVAPKTNFLYFEGKDYPPTSFFIALYEGEVQPLAPTSLELSQKVPWKKTNHILFSRFQWKEILYTPAIFLTNNGPKSFFLLAIHVSNTSTNAREIGFRFLLDTTLQENTSNPLFWFENGATVSSEMEISLNQYGQYLASGNGKTGLFLLPMYNGFSPRSVYLANYHRLKTSLATVTIEPQANFVYGWQGKRDGAMMVEYRYRLRGGESLEGGIILSTEPPSPVQWNTTLFDFLTPPSSVATPSNQPTSQKPALTKTNVIVLTNTISITRGDTNYLALQQALIERLENLIAAITNLSPQPGGSVSFPQTNTPSRNMPSSSSSFSWFPSDDPFGEKPSLPQKKSQQNTPTTPSPVPTLSPSTSTSPPITPQPKEEPLTVIPSATPSLPSTVFITNIITNYVTISNAQTSSSLLSTYEEQIQRLQKQLIDIESRQQGSTSSSGKLAIIEKRLELLNWLLEKNQQVNLSAEDIAAMNAELDSLLQALQRGSTP